METAETLITDHLPLVSHVVADIAPRLPRHVRRDELVSAAMYGLVQAARSYDATRGVEFASFARTRIRGAVIDELRRDDWATRSVRTRARWADAVAEELTGALQRTPTSAEIAGRLGVDAATVAQLAADVERATVLHYDSIVFGGDAEGLLGVAGPGPEAHLVARERCHYLNDAVSALPERMRTVVVALFFEDRTAADVAAELGVTEARVSQIRAEALALLREGMTTHLDAPPEHLQASGGRVAKRKAAYFAAVGAASDYRSRLTAELSDAAERVAAAGL